MFKRADKMFEKLGYKKIHEGIGLVRYEKHIGEYNYVRYIDLVQKRATPSIVQNYDKSNEHTDGMNKFEMRAAIRKMKEMGWK